MTEENRFRIAIADDSADVLVALRLLLKPAGFVVAEARSPGELLTLVRREEFDVALIDLNYTRDTTSGGEGLDLLTELARLDSLLPVIVMTAWGSIEVAVEAVRRGARDFVQKPWENASMVAILRAQSELCRALRANQRLQTRNELLESPLTSDVIAQSVAMRPVLELIQRVGPSTANVLFTGEHGTGKEVVARALHAISPRAARPMICVNAGSIPEALFESELFGHQRGAFTGASADRPGRFELADQGTLLLDEIGNLPLAQQAKLLRAVESGEFERLGSPRVRHADVRLISATNSDLASAVAAGAFREDLLFRINTVHIHLPPLRERGEDILLLAHHFLERYTAKYARAVPVLDTSAVEALHAHRWPGNVRELQHVLERAVLLCRGDVISAADLGLAAPARTANYAPGTASAAATLNLEQNEREVIRRALEACAGNVIEAARVLGLSRSGLYRRLQRYGLS
ncbi:MAG: sigma-54 dependent transcriptional regulator [Bryobacteraceae bacterium]|jgi:DNA-binding NtrC family response regulator